MKGLFVFLLSNKSLTSANERLLSLKMLLLPNLQRLFSVYHLGLKTCNPFPIYDNIPSPQSLSPSTTHAITGYGVTDGPSILPSSSSSSSTIKPQAVSFQSYLIRNSLFTRFFAISRINTCTLSYSLTYFSL